MKGKYIQYAIIGQDKVYSQVPIDLTNDGHIVLCDAMYDIADTPLYIEAINYGLPAIVDSGEYFNMKTGLYMTWAEE